MKIREALRVLHEMDVSQMETTLLRSCFALPKFSYLIRTCPPTHISRATMDFDVAMREALESILGGPLSEWSWLKASLPSSRGGVNLRSASLHAPAAFLAYISRFQTLVGEMLGHAPGLSPHTSSTVCALSSAASRPDWQCLTCLCASTLSHLPLTRPCTSASSRRHPPPVLAPWPSHLRCPTPETGSMEYHLPPWVSSSTTRSSAAACGTGWEFHFIAPPTPAQNAAAQRTPLVTTRLVVGAMGIGLHATMPSVTSSSVPPNPLPWPLRGRCPTWSPTPSPDQLTCSSPPAAVVVLPPWTSTLSPHSSRRPWERLPPPLATPCGSVSNANWHLTSRLADLQGCISFPSSLRRWEVWQRTLSPPSALSGRPLLRGSAPKTPPPAPSISSTESPSPCGGGTPAFGCTASQPSPPQWTV